MVPMSINLLRECVIMMDLNQITAESPLSERGKKILNAAQVLFLKHGYKDTSLEMIINESGGSRRSIYSEFGNKQGLLIAVIREHIANQVGTLQSINYHVSPEQALKETAIQFLTGMLHETLIALFRLVIHIVPELPKIGKLIYQYGPLSGSDPIKHYLIHLDKEKLLDIDDADFAAKLFIEMIKGRLHIKAILVPNETISSQEICEHVEKSVALFLKMYKREDNY